MLQHRRRRSMPVTCRAVRANAQATSPGPQATSSGVARRRSRRVDDQLQRRRVANRRRRRERHRLARELIDDGVVVGGHEPSASTRDGHEPRPRLHPNDHQRTRSRRKEIFNYGARRLGDLKERRSRRLASGLRSSVPPCSKPFPTCRPGRTVAWSALPHVGVGQCRIAGRRSSRRLQAASCRRRRPRGGLLVSALEPAGVAGARLLVHSAQCACGAGRSPRASVTQAGRATRSSASGSAATMAAWPSPPRRGRPWLRSCAVSICCLAPPRRRPARRARACGRGGAAGRIAIRPCGGPTPCGSRWRAALLAAISTGERRAETASPPARPRRSGRAA